MGESTGKGSCLDPAESAARTTRQFPVKTNRTDFSRHSLPEVESVELSVLPTSSMHM